MLKLQFKDRRKPAMWLVDSVLKIGSGSGCDILIDEAMVDPIHAELEILHDDILLRNVSKNRSVFVNGVPVMKQQAVKAWDVIRIGQSELELIDPLSERAQTPEQTPSKATVIRAAVSPWMLKALTPPLDGQYFSLTNGMIVGREDASDIKLPFSYISRKHLKLIIADDKLFVEDLGSSNGTFVNGTRINTRHPLVNNDELRLDEFIFHVIGAGSETKARVPQNSSTQAKAKPVRKDSKPNFSATIRKAPSGKKIFLHVLSGEHKGKCFEMLQPDNHVSRLLGHHLSTAEKSVSARHVYLKETDLGWMIKNDGASDGLLVNGKMQSKALLQDDDDLLVGGIHLKFQCQGDEPRQYQSDENDSAGGFGKWIVVLLVLAAAATGVYFSGLLN